MVHARATRDTRGDTGQERVNTGTRHRRDTTGTPGGAANGECVLRNAQYTLVPLTRGDDDATPTTGQASDDDDDAGAAGVSPRREAWQ
jgi:hypothetical protein